MPLAVDVPVPHEPHPGESHADQSQGAAPVWNALVPAAPVTPARPESAQTQQLQQEAPSMWDTHPLTHPGVAPVRELPVEAPRQELPRPDLSALLNTQANPSVGQQVQLRTTEPLTTTGAMPQRPSELQRLPEPHPGGGARHFRWAHLAVIGAIAFVLGVLAWNIARSGS